jgi:hypothetical protein
VDRRGNESGNNETNKRIRDKLMVTQNKRRLHYSLGTKHFNAVVFLEFM